MDLPGVSEARPRDTCLDDAPTCIVTPSLMQSCILKKFLRSVRWTDRPIDAVDRCLISRYVVNF